MDRVPPKYNRALLSTSMLLESNYFLRIRVFFIFNHLIKNVLTRENDIFSLVFYTIQCFNYITYHKGKARVYTQKLYTLIFLRNYKNTNKKLLKRKKEKKTRTRIALMFHWAQLTLVSPIKTRHFLLHLKRKDAIRNKGILITETNIKSHDTTNHKQ